MNQRTEKLAHDLYESCSEMTGKPSSIAAGAVYTASSINNESITQNQVAEVAKVSGVTIRKWFSIYLDNYNSTNA